jgi:hypothetical protein
MSKGVIGRGKGVKYHSETLAWRLSQISLSVKSCLVGILFML